MFMTDHVVLSMRHMTHLYSLLLQQIKKPDMHTRAVTMRLANTEHARQTPRTDAHWPVRRPFAAMGCAQNLR